MLKGIAFLAVLASLASPAYSEKPLRVTGGDLWLWGFPVELWGVELPDWRPIPGAPPSFPAMVQPLCEHGVNALGIPLQTSGDRGRFFAADGSLLEEDKGSFSSGCFLIGDYWLVPVVSVFSAERANWLGSADAYRAAAQVAARLLAKRRAAILVAGDVFGTTEWSADCPYPMRDPAAVIELCRLMKAANPDAMLAIPANLLPSSPSDCMLYAAETPDALTQLLKRDAADSLPDGVVALRRSRFLRLADIHGDRNAATRQYLEHVARERMAVQLSPATQPAGKATEQLTAAEKADGFVPLFDGATLNGWTTLTPSWHSWRVEDGVIHCLGKGGTWLRTRQAYSSFILRIEFKTVPEGNTGLFLWAPIDGRCSRFGMEMQILGLHRDPPNDDTTGAIYKIMAPRKDAGREPLEWNRAEVECRGSRVKISINDQLVQDFDADAVPALKGRLRQGLIGLQDHAFEAWFRKIRIRPLN